MLAIGSNRTGSGDDLKHTRLIDLSLDVYEGAPVFPGHPQTLITLVDTFEQTRLRFSGGYGYTSEKIEMSTHGTTHVDSISHIDPTPGAPTIDVIPLDWFYTSAICLDLSSHPLKTVFTPQMVDDALSQSDLEIRPGDTVLINSGHYERYWGKPGWLTDYSGLSGDAARYIFERGALNIGQDAPSIDCAFTTSFPAHQVCREMQRLNTENLANLRPVTQRRFTFVAFPLKIRGGSGSPVRAVGIVEDI
jgi:kynurenine formamidase